MLDYVYRHLVSIDTLYHSRAIDHILAAARSRTNAAKHPSVLTLCRYKQDGLIFETDEAKKPPFLREHLIRQSRHHDEDLRAPVYSQRPSNVLQQLQKS